VGGLSYKHARALLARSNATGLMLIGDSLVEQIFHSARTTSRAGVLGRRLA